MVASGYSGDGSCFGKYFRTVFVVIRCVNFYVVIGIGIVFHINGFDYFAPLSSFKDKHRPMKEGLDFIKIKDYAVINLNNMFPVPLSETKYVDIRNERDPHYRALLLAEYRFIKSIQEKIWKNAQNVYKVKIKDGESSSLAKRCNDFFLLEKACEDYR